MSQATETAAKLKALCTKRLDGVPAASHKDVYVEIGALEFLDVLEQVPVPAGESAAATLFAGKHAALVQGMTGALEIASDRLTKTVTVRATDVLLIVKSLPDVSVLRPTSAVDES